jgi:hypothetical protein
MNLPQCLKSARKLLIAARKSSTFARFCKSLIINDLRRQGLAPTRKSLTASDLRTCKFFFVPEVLDY